VDSRVRARKPTKFKEWPGALRSETALRVPPQPFACVLCASCVTDFDPSQAAVNFCENWAALCGILLFAFQSENYPIFQHGAKEHDFDMFWFVVLTFGAFSLLNIRPTKDPAVLGREQSEEWKGWMQFMFLLYHYYEVGEVYNAIRVMITAYVWMTGFGNGLFFSNKQDFGVVRVLHMLWRLNFFVLMLMMVNNTTYILYYICPLHTFWFLMCWAVMYVAHKVGGRHPLARQAAVAVFGVATYLLWDTSGTVFDLVFGKILGNKPSLGAKSGVAWEWYFRTTLDHWSALLGIVFAVNYPRFSAWLQTAAELPPGRSLATIGAPLVAVAALFAWWLRDIFVLKKLQYNQFNAYTGMIPVLGYIFLRNCHPFLRRWYVYPLYEFGKTTLETYLLQHHVWLTSNAKTVFTVLPGMPKSNFLVCTVIFIALSRKTFRVVAALRTHVLPDNDARLCARNLGALAGAMAALYTIALVFTGMFPLPLRLLAIGATGCMLAWGAFMLLLVRETGSESSQGAELEPLSTADAQSGREPAASAAPGRVPVVSVVLALLYAFSLFAAARQAPPAVPARCLEVCVRAPPPRAARCAPPPKAAGAVSLRGRVQLFALTAACGRRCAARRGTGSRCTTCLGPRASGRSAP